MGTQLKNIRSMPDNQLFNHHFVSQIGFEALRWRRSDTMRRSLFSASTSGAVLRCVCCSGVHCASAPLKNHVQIVFGTPTSQTSHLRAEEGGSTSSSNYLSKYITEPDVFKNDQAATDTSSGCLPQYTFSAASQEPNEIQMHPPQIILCEMLDEENAGHAVTMRIEYPSLIPADGIKIIGSCNGLLCFMVADAFTEDMTDNRFILWNPSTRACRELAKPGPLLGNFPKTIPIYGFGYDPTTDDYKVIRAVSPDNGTTSTDLEIYNLKDNAWRKMQASLPCILTHEYLRTFEPEFPGIFSRRAGVYTNGALHWLQKRDRNMKFHESDLILSFNLAKEEFEEVIPLLDYDKEDSYPSELRVFGGNLSIVVYKLKTGEIKIWVMKEYGMKGSWTKMATMPDDPGPAFIDSFMDYWFVPFLSCGNGRLLVDMSGSGVLIYDPLANTFSEIELRGDQSLFLVQDFVESLVSPHGI